MVRIKIIQINPSSPSIISKNINQVLFDNWYARVGIYLKKYNPKLEVECWTPERTAKKITEIKKFGIKFKIFPSTFMIRFGKEISLPMIKELKKEVKKQPTIIHMHEQHSYQNYLISSVFKKTPLVAQHHAGRAPLYHIQKNKKYAALFPLLATEHIFERFAFKNIDQFFTLTQFEEKYLKKFIKKDKIRNLTMGVDFDNFKPINKQKARKKLDLPKNKTIFTYVGSLIPRKRINHLISAFSQVNKEDKNTFLVIIGEGDLKKQLQDQVKRLNLQNSVKFTGYIDNYLNPEILPTYFSASDAYVSASSWEGASVSIMEAMACNLPIISTKTGNAPETIDKETGILVEIDDVKDLKNKLFYLIKNKSKFKNIRKKAQMYDWKNIIKETLKSYKKLEREYFK